MDVELLDCPKCGSIDTAMRYCDACQHRYQGGVGDAKLCRHGDVEHFHRWCLRCKYIWRTDDAINAVVRCDSRIVP